MIPLTLLITSRKRGRLVADTRRPFLALAREEAERRVLSFMTAKKPPAIRKVKASIGGAHGEPSLRHLRKNYGTRIAGINHV